MKEVIEEYGEGIVYLLCAAAIAGVFAVFTGEIMI